MLSADSRGIFPQCAGNLRGQTLFLGVRGPFFGDDGDTIPEIEENP